MSLREVSSSTPFLAKKGAAAPASPGVARGGPAGLTLRSIESDREILLESAPAEAAAGNGTNEDGADAGGAGGKRTVEATPAASLLPFDLLRRKYRPDAVPDLIEDEPDIAPVDFAAIPELKPEPEQQQQQQAELALRVDSEAPVKSGIRVKSDAAAEPALELKTPPPLAPDAGPRLDAPSLSPAPTPTLAPGPKPEWRVGVDVPAQSPHSSAKSTSSGGWLLPLGALAAAFAALVVGWNMTNPDFDLGSWLAPEPTVTSESVGEVAAKSADVPVNEAAAPTSVEPPPPIAETPTAAEPELAAPELASPELAAPAPLQTSLPEPAQSPPADSTANAGTSAVSNQGKLVPAQTAPVAVAAPPVKPTVDVVRLEANGDAVIAGRAAPNSELIVLDKGEPIGTVKADAFGEWVFVPEVALPIGDHEFALVVKTVRESVNLPAPSAPTPSIPAPSVPSLPPAPALTPDPEPAPAASESALEFDSRDLAAADVEVTEAPAVAPTIGGDEAAAQPIPIPAHKPEPANDSAAPTDGQTEAQAETPLPQHEEVSAENTAAADTPDFVVQLASVKTRAGAEQEWRKIKRKFPELLSGMVPALDEVKLVDYGTVIRVRTGAFDSQRDAATLCAQLAEKRQACLVVNTVGGN